MAEGDITYNRNTGSWYIEEGIDPTPIPLSASTNPFYKALAHILRQISISAEYTQENIDSILEAAWKGAEDQMTQNQAPETPKTTYPGQVIKGETIGGPPGSFFLQDPNGNLTPYTPPKTPTSGMTFAEAANYIGDRAERPEEFTRWREALMAGPGGAQDAQSQAPQYPPGYNAQGNPAQYHDFQGNPVANPFQAKMDAQANRPFPAFPDTLGVPGGVGPQNPYGATANPNDVLNAFQTGSNPAQVPQSFTAAIQQDLANVTTTQRGQLTQATQGGYVRVRNAEGRESVIDAKDRAVWESAGWKVTEAPASPTGQGGEQSQPSPQEASDLAKYGENPNVPRPTFTGGPVMTRLQQEGMAQEARSAQASPGSIGTVKPKGLTWQEALAEIEQKDRTQRALRGQGRTVFA